MCVANSLVTRIVLHLYLYRMCAGVCYWFMLEHQRTAADLVAAGEREVQSALKVSFSLRVADRVTPSDRLAEGWG